MAWSISSLEPESIATERQRPLSHFLSSLPQFLTRLLGQTTMAFSISGLASLDCFCSSISTWQRGTEQRNQERPHERDALQRLAEALPGA